MKGADFVAVKRISNRATERVKAMNAAGVEVMVERDKWTVLAEEGHTCERVPADALPWLLEGGDIAPKPKAARAPKATADEPTEGGE